jgi:PAS domain S-box-containing protein
MARSNDSSGWFWVTLVLSCITIVALVFATWELVEHRFFRQVSYAQLHALYITRGIASSLLLAAWATWFVLRERRRSEEELRRSRERYLGILQSSPEAIVLLDEQHRVVEWNPGAERLYGYSPGDVLGKPLQTIPPELAAEFAELAAQVHHRGRVEEFESLRLDQRGEKLDVGVELSSYQETRGERYVLEVSRDIRERVRLRQRALEIEKLTTMGKMAAGIAHHLNTPLAAMLLRTEMLRSSDGDGSLTQELERIEAGIRACQQFVQRLLHFAQRAKGKPQVLNVCEAAQSVVSFLELNLRKKNVHVECRMQPAELCIEADRNQFEALVSILVMNACDALDSRGDGRILIQGGIFQEHWAEILVTDNGSGISAGVLPHVFEPFFTTKGPEQGTGLGLPIARGIVEEAGGTIEIGPNADGGTRVRILWPRAPSLVLAGISQAVKTPARSAK